MKIALDGIALATNQPGGYRTYAANLVQRLGSISSSHEWLLLVDRSIDLRSAPGWNVQSVSRRGRAGFVWREQVALPAEARRQHVDLLHSPAATGPLNCLVPQIVTIHDTIEFSQPLPSPRAARLWTMRVYNRFVQKRIALRTRRILTVSEYSKRCVAGLFRIPAQQIVAIHNAPAPLYRPLDRPASLAQAYQRFGVCNQVLAIASTAARKNIDRLMAAYAQLSPPLQKIHPLTLVCTHTGVRAHLDQRSESLGLQRQVVFVEAATDDDLLYLYNSAAVFVFPSLEEGFGLPPLEAMACGTPVVASNTSSLPEVLGDAALLVTPTDTQAISVAITSILRDPALAEDLRIRGLARSQQFSWDKTARETLAVYEQAAGAHST